MKMGKTIFKNDRDRCTFYSVQIERYLKRKTIHKFCSEAEKDVVNQIISDAWEHCSGEMKHKSDYSEKVLFCYSCVLVFPYFIAEEETVIPVDFKAGKVINYRNNCTCGSGLPYFECCGSVSGWDSPDIGPF